MGVESRGANLWRGLVCGTPVFSETTIKGRFAENFFAVLGLSGGDNKKAVPRIGVRPKESVFVGHLNCNGWLRVIEVKGAACRNQFNQLGGAIIVADVQGNRNAA